MILHCTVWSCFLFFQVEAENFADISTVGRRAVFAVKMGNCMGQRKLGGGGSRKENAAKTPMKDDDEKATRQRWEGKGQIAENWSRKGEGVKVDAFVKKELGDGVNHNKDINDEKKSESWFVINEPDEKKTKLDAIENQGKRAKDSTGKEKKAKKHERVPFFVIHCCTLF